MIQKLPNSRSSILVLFLLFLTFFIFISNFAEGNNTPPDKSWHKLKLKAEPFKLTEVQLLPSRFKSAQETNREYMLKLDINLLTYPFRREAGIPSPIKGSDSQLYAFNGSYLGHYLSACAIGIANTNDSELKKRSSQVIDILEECQNKIGTGFVMGFSQQRLIDYINTGKLARLIHDPGTITVPWYSLHKVYAGLFDMYVLGGNPKALEILKKSADWLCVKLENVPEDRWKILMNNELGGMSEVLANLYEITGKKEYLSLSLRFEEEKLMKAMDDNIDTLDMAHANSRIPRFSGTIRQYMLTSQDYLYKRALNFWKMVFPNRSYVTGGNSNAEIFTPLQKMSRFMTNTAETCNTYNMLKLTRYLFFVDPRVEFADYYERALYNHILHSQRPQIGGFLYYHLLQSGTPITEKWSEPNVGFLCCYGTGMENQVKYADSIYFRGDDQSLYVNLYIPSELQWKEEGLVLRQEGDYLKNKVAEFKVMKSSGKKLKFKFRCPQWANSSKVEVFLNNTKSDTKIVAGEYISIDRVWNVGDTVQVKIPFEFRTEGFKDNPKRVGILYGPLVMAAGTEYGNRFSSIVSPDENFLKTFKPVEGKVNEFFGSEEIFRKSPLKKESAPIILKPLNTFVDEPKIVYWDEYDEKTLNATTGIFQIEADRINGLREKTVDWVLCGVRNKEQMEKNNFTIQGYLLNSGLLQGESLDSIVEDNHGFKLSEPTKFFRPIFDIFVEGHVCLFNYVFSNTISYQLKVSPKLSQQLQVTVWRPELDRFGSPIKIKGGIEILVNDKVILEKTNEEIPLETFHVLKHNLTTVEIGHDPTIKISIRSLKREESSYLGIYECRIVKK